jgi:uncharacterized protein YgiM (DUF1202 family)
LDVVKKTAAVILAVMLFAVTVVPAAANEVEEQSRVSDTKKQSAASASSSVAYLEVNEIVYAIGTVNVRTGPGTQYQRLGELDYGYSVTRIGVGDNGWSMVIWQDQVAYIFSAYLSRTRPKGLNTQIDDTQLLLQIAIANGLSRADYTTESWLMVADALALANDALNGDSQAAADDAEKALIKAMDGLVKMDYSELRSVLEEAEQMVSESETTTMWYELSCAAYNGQILLSSGSQVDVDAAVVQIRDLMAQTRDMMEKQESLNVVIKEVPVEVPPAGDFCNIARHRVWPVLFAVSAVLNVALVAVMVIYIHNKKKNQKDDTPLVDYDIFDDTI